MDIFQSDACPLVIFFMTGLVTVQQGVQSVQRVLVHADAVVHDRQHNAVFLLFRGQLDMPRTVHRLDAVDKGVFNNRL